MKEALLACTIMLLNYIPSIIRYKLVKVVEKFEVNMVIQKQKEVFTSTDIQQCYNSRVMLCMSVCGLQRVVDEYGDLETK